MIEPVSPLTACLALHLVYCAVLDYILSDLSPRVVCFVEYPVHHAFLTVSRSDFALVDCCALCAILLLRL